MCLMPWCYEDRNTYSWTLVPGNSHLEFEIAVAMLKEYKYPGTDQIPAELFQGGGEMLVFQSRKLLHSIWNAKEFS
jgi:hypothetical protein